VLPKALRSFIKSNGIPFLIEDDDVNYFTSAEHLRDIYKVLIMRGFKVSFAVIPFVKDIKMPYVIQKRTNTKQYFPIGMNEELCEYLRSGKGIDIALHGYAHSEEPGISEFNNLSSEETFRRVSKGKDYLESLFRRKIYSFVPPHRYITPCLVTSLNNLGLMLFTDPHLFLTRGLSIQQLIHRKSMSVVLMSVNFISLMKHALYHLLVGDARKYCRNVCDIVKPFSVRQLAYFDYLFKEASMSVNTQTKSVTENLCKVIIEKILRIKPLVIVIASHHWSFMNEISGLNAFMINTLNEMIECLYDFISLYPMGINELAKLLCDSL
jgi:hypothetical protein